MLFLTIPGESNQPKVFFQLGEVFGVSRLFDEDHSEKYREIIIQTDAADSEHWCCVSSRCYWFWVVMLWSYARELTV